MTIREDLAILGIALFIMALCVLSGSL